MTKRKLREAIVETEQEIEALEKKLFRSQTVLLLALIEGKTPDPMEVDFFKMYTSLIEQLRKRLLEYDDEYNNRDHNGNEEVVYYNKHVRAATED